MEAQNLIKERISKLKEKELREGLNSEEQLELGRLYITDEINEAYEQIAELKKNEYWKSRYQLLEDFFSKTPCEHDATEEQKEARKRYEHFINNNKQSE